MSTIIFPMTMIPKNITFKLYFLSFPTEWKKKMLELQLLANPNFNTNYPMKTNVLYGYLNGWLDDVVGIKPLKVDSDDSDWLISIKEPDLKKICEIIMIWAAAEYGDNKNTTDKVGEFISSVNEESLSEGVRCIEEKLFDDSGCALKDYAFNAFSICAADILNGSSIKTEVGIITLHSSGAKSLISDPICFRLRTKQKEYYYSLGVDFSLQTTPPKRKCMLLFHLTTKRFIPDTWKEPTDTITIDENINAYVRMDSGKYRRINILSDKFGKDRELVIPHRWSKPEAECYKLYSSKNLPDCDAVLRTPNAFVTSDPQILLPFKYGMRFTEDSRIGTGISMIDKKNIYLQLAELLNDIADLSEPVSNERTEPKKKGISFADRRERLKKCTGYDSFTIEVYGHSSDRKLFDEIKSYAEEKRFGDSSYDSILPIDISFCELGSLGSVMQSSGWNDTLRKIDDVVGTIKASAKVIGAIIVLPNYEGECGDPKNALRAGFADTNRLTQFITPFGFISKNGEQETEKQREKREAAEKSRAHSAFDDLLRQFGYTEYISDSRRKKEIYSSDAIGICLFKMLQPLWGRNNSSVDRAKLLPLQVTCNLENAGVFVDCHILNRVRVPYHEALIMFSKLSREKDFVEKCCKAENAGARSMLMGLYSLYRSSPAVLFIQANGVTRQYWHGITDKQLSEYSMLDEYIPEKIDIGSRNGEVIQGFTDSELRIIRVRSNASMYEIPDYYTAPSNKNEGELRSASGIFKYNQVFWILEGRPDTKEYRNSVKRSRFKNPDMCFDECGLVELFPIQLQKNDTALDWIRYANVTRDIMPETNKSMVKLPAPLHFATLMEEYLLLK